MSNISSSQVIQKPDTLVDPNNFLPPGVIGIAYEERDAPSDGAIASAQDALTSDSVMNDGVDYSSIYVVSQTVRIDRLGRYTVDVVLSVPDRKGVTSWDVRISKV